MYSRRTFRAAFTLLELILVMLVITIAVGIIAPLLVNFAQGRKTSNAAVMILALARYARTQAAEEGAIYRMNFDGNKIYLSTDGGSEGAGFQRVAASDFGNDYTLPDGVQIQYTVNPRPLTQVQFPDLLQTGTVQQEQPLNGQQNGLQGTLVGVAREGGQYIEFDPTGRQDPAQIVLKDGYGSTVELLSQTPSEPLRILSDAEMGRR
jgi:Tfp pilus assembly protein FimT